MQQHLSQLEKVDRTRKNIEAPREMYGGVQWRDMLRWRRRHGLITSSLAHALSWDAHLDTWESCRGALCVGEVPPPKLQITQANIIQKQSKTKTFSTRSNTKRKASILVFEELLFVSWSYNSLRNAFGKHLFRLHALICTSAVFSAHIPSHFVAIQQAKRRK